MVVTRSAVFLAALFVSGFAQAINEAKVTPSAPSLPKVLIIGDSISIGYTDAVRLRLEHEADVQRIPSNGQSTDFGLENIDAWLGDQNWDVIHFNWGIWDTHIIEGKRIRNTTKVYDVNLRKLVERLKATGATLVWASTTPVTFDLFENGLGVEKKNIPIYNNAAKSVMDKFRIPIDDLYSRVLPRLLELQTRDGVHFTPAGSEFLAGSVAESIRQALAVRKEARVDAIANPTQPHTPSLATQVTLEQLKGAAQITLPSLETYTLVVLELAPAPSS